MRPRHRGYVRGPRHRVPVGAALLGGTPGDPGGDPTVPTAAFTVGTTVGVPTGTSLTTRTSLGSATSTGTFTITDPTGRENPVTLDVDIFEAIEYTTNRVVVHRTTGNVRLFRNCRFAVAAEVTMVECDEEGYQVANYMSPRTIFDHCTFDGTSTSSKAVSGGNMWMEYCHVTDCEDGLGGPFCSVAIGSNIISTTDGLAEPHCDGVQLLGIGKAIFWNCFIDAGSVVGAASQALRIGSEFSTNDNVTVAWSLLDGNAGGWTLQSRGDAGAAPGNTNVHVYDCVVLPGGFGSVDFVDTTVATWARVYSDTYGGTPISNPAP